jgi:probable F420-dependent oxidoreductase
MKIGVVFPQAELGSDVNAIREYVLSAEDIGYTHIFIADHVLGADPKYHLSPDASSMSRSLSAEYSHESVVHEPFTLMAYIAALTKTLELTTGILILPQRQTALVAKQAAEIDVLSGGRMRLGIGVGWNPVEFEALGENFHDRGQRSEEQIEVMRSLWTNSVVDFHGKWHNITHAGINPRPIQHSIPVWIGAGSGPTLVPSNQILRRIARIADGWFPMFPPDGRAQFTTDRIRQHAEEIGRNPDSIGMEGRVRTANKTQREWSQEIKAWELIGASHLAVETRKAGLKFPNQHIEVLRQFKETLHC